MAFWYVRLPNETWGPLTDERIRRYLADGFVAMDTLVDKGDESTSRPAAQWKELFEDAAVSSSSVTTKQLPAEVVKEAPKRLSFPIYGPWEDLIDYAAKDPRGYCVFYFVLIGSMVLLGLLALAAE